MKKGLGIAAVAGSVTALQAFQQDSVEETGTKVKLLSPEGEIVEIDSGYLKPIPEVNIAPDQAREGIPGRRFVMVIDLARCKNLRKCHDACDKMHHCGPEKEFLKVLKMQALWSPALGCGQGRRQTCQVLMRTFLWAKSLARFF